jgi:hypothetical protein
MAQLWDVPGLTCAQLSALGRRVGTDALELTTLVSTPAFKPQHQIAPAEVKAQL